MSYLGVLEETEMSGRTTVLPKTPTEPISDWMVTSRAMWCVALPHLLPMDPMGSAPNSGSLGLKQCFSLEMVLSPRHSVMSRDIFDCHNVQGMGRGCYWHLVGRGHISKYLDAAKHPTVHRIAPTTKNHLAQNINNSAEILKPCSEDMY